jgi:hypothetical protein
VSTNRGKARPTGHTGRSLDRLLELELHTRIAATEVGLDGEMLPVQPSLPALAATDRGWYYDAGDRYGVIHIRTGRVTTRIGHSIVVTLADGEPAATGSYPVRPAGDGAISADNLMVISRPAEEPGHPLENAFDADPDTWFRTVRDQSVAYGPHELTLSLGGRRMVAGFRISPRNDKHWQYGQVRSYQVYLADVNGRWGEPVATGVLEQTREQQEVLFEPRAGRLLRLRVLGTHDDGIDPMVLGAGSTGGDADPQTLLEAGLIGCW